MRLLLRPSALSSDAMQSALQFAYSRRVQAQHHALKGANAHRVAGVEVGAGSGLGVSPGDCGTPGGATEGTTRVVRGSGTSAVTTPTTHAGAPRRVWFPETLRRDAVMLTEMQNSLQRIALSASMVATLQAVRAAPKHARCPCAAVRSHHVCAAHAVPMQVLSSCKACPKGVPLMPLEQDKKSPSTIEELVHSIDAWLQSDTITREDLIAGLESSARRIAVQRGLVLQETQVQRAHLPLLLWCVSENVKLTPWALRSSLLFARLSKPEFQRSIPRSCCSTSVPEPQWCTSLAGVYLPSSS